MEAENFTIGIYNQNCVMGGNACHIDEQIEQESDDLTIYKGTADELREQAELMMKHAGSNAGGAHARKSARSIMEVIGDQYRTQDREAGNAIDSFAFLRDAQKAIEQYETDDKDDEDYTPDFYEIAVLNNTTGNWEPIKQ